MLNYIKKTKFFYNYIRMQHTQHKIHLTEQEEKIFNFFLTYRQQLQLKTVFRVAGGWVRDKMMGIQCNDIDITLDDMKGEQFVNLIKKHAETKNQKISGFGVTKFNPQMSKHLETATIKLFDHDIDIVNLRSEIYSDDSRIPTIEIGTPKEDAQRRDFTINSLFYNILTKEVEDHTQIGIVDLQKGIIRTPLQPKITFIDDPLRVLRCFRFAGRYNFKIVPEIQQAIHDKVVIESLRTKVSKQRIGIQLAGMLKSKNPLIALSYIKQHHLWNVVFEIPKNTTLIEANIIQQIPQISFNCLQKYLQSIEKNKFITYEDLITNEIKQNQKNQKIKHLADQFKIMTRLSCLTQFYRNYKKLPEKNKKNSEPLIQVLIKQQLKYSKDHARFACKIADGIDKFYQIDDLMQINKIIRWLRVSEQKWEIILHIIQGIRSFSEYKKQFSPMQLRQYVLKEQLQYSYLAVPHIDGNYLGKLGKKGPIMKTILDNCTIWRILNPTKSKEQFIELLNTKLQFFENQKVYD